MHTIDSQAFLCFFTKTGRKVLDLLERGKSPEEIQRVLPSYVPLSSVLSFKNFLDGRKIEIDRKSTFETFRELAEAGFSARELSEIFNTSKASIQRYARKNSISLTRQPNSNKIQIPDIEDLQWCIDRKMNFIEIGKKFKTSRTTVMKWFKFYDLKPSRNKK